MENDDKPIGQILSRRAALKVLGIGSAAFLAACAAPEEIATLAPTGISTQVSSTASTVLDCIVRPELTIGPYFVDEQLARSDIRANSSDNTVKEGIPLMLNINVASVSDNSCTPIQGAQVDIWHCDAQGQYSGVSDQDLTAQDKISFAAISSQMQTAPCSFGRSIQAGIQGGLSTSTLRFAPGEPTQGTISSLHSFSLTMI
ncbi:MAG TPA: hypothetical protein VFS61_08575 [Anaerolineales bacterium]|nr:hypothetical protein [Anaerolineales bacterium]